MDTETIKQRTVPVLKRHGAVEAYVFGSAARGELSADSDVDILVRFDRLRGLFEFVRTKRELSQALGRSVDLVEVGALREEMRPSVEKDKIRIV